MLRIFGSRALIACVCLAPVAIAMGDVSWQAEEGTSSLVLDSAALEQFGIVAKGDDSLQPGVFRAALIGPSNLSIDSNHGEIRSTSGGALVQSAGLTLTSSKIGTQLQLDNIAIVVEAGDDITSLVINDAATGEAMFRVDAVRAVFAPVSRVLALEGGSLVGTKALAKSLGIEALSGAVMGRLHARFVMAWAGGDDPSTDPGYPAAGGAPRGGNNGTDCHAATGQDVIVGSLYNIDNPSSQNISGVWYDTFSVGTASCNIGDAILTWQGSGGTVHPVIGQNCFRLKDGRFEQIGQSWLKHGFTVAAGNECGCGCTGPGGPTLYPGCSDPYGATLNNSQSSIKPKWRVNPTTGVHDHNESAPAITGSASRRLQVRHSDIDPALNAGAVYFHEGQYVHQEDAQSGNDDNNASYRQVTVSSSGSNEYSFSLAGTTMREQCGIRAWQDTDPTVTESDVEVPNEGLYIVASKATNNGNGTWHYEYAVQNLNGNRGMSSFSVPIDPSATVTNIGFHDVDYHDGDGEGNANRDGTDWPGVHSGSSVTWTMVDVGTNSNAMLWGTMYNFRFDANRPPAANNPNATLTMWRAGAPATAQGGVQGPDIGPQDCQSNGVEDGTDIANGTSQDCNSDGVPDECQSFAPSTLTAEVVVTGLSTDKPVFVCAPPGDTGRLFIVTQVGRIYIYNLGTQSLNATPFLDISGQTTTNGERGLLGMAFHPNYASNGKFYINHTDLSGDTLIRQYTVSGDPDVANAASGVTLKTIAQPFSNHNAGCLQFSPNDGYLYAAMGDGGSANDPSENAQNDGSLLGKMLRLDVDNPPSYVPASNPGPLPEVWAKGLRNPWRFSFDRRTGDIYIGDVGQDTREEVDYQSASSIGGENYGWDCREGLIAAPGDGVDNFGCDPNGGGYTDPILDYNTNDGNNCTIIGGYVYRGCAIPWLNGTYFYADWCAGWVKTFRYDGNALSDGQDVTADLNDGISGSMNSIVSFGEDAAGELYIVSYGGTIYRIIEAGPPPVCGNNMVESGEQCDDGNTQAGDGCSPTCQTEIPVCGNGIVDLGEECDDGNTMSGDGCDSMCQSENVPGADLCANAVPIGDGVYDFDTTAAGTDGNAHSSCQFDGQTYQDIWWQYNATCDGNLSVSLCGSGYDTDLVIYDTCACTPTDANLAGCNDDGCPGSAPDTYRSQLTVPVIAGNCYLIRVGGWSSGDAGIGTMTISNSGAPCNTCGNGNLEAGEQCDDGNTTGGDGCSAVCQFEFDDCNNNSVDDLDDIAMGTSQDCNNNSVPDECEIASGAADDCNENGIPDECELADGSASDCNNNGVLDICDTPSSPEETKMYAVSPGLAIPDNNATGASSTINVPESGTVLDVNVTLEITHTWIGDLEIDITHGGVTVLLFNGCGNNDNMNITFDDEGSALVCASPTTGTVTPTEALSGFDGMNKSGDWTVRIVDTAGQDIGTLDTWTLEIVNEGTGTTGADCNNNGIDDAIDMAQGTESDCDSNCVPDSCQIANNAALDCNNNGQLDSCEVAADPSLDCDGGPIGDPSAGATIFGTYCFGCHNVDGTGGPGYPGPNIRNKSRTFIGNFLPAPTTHPGGAFNFSAQQFADIEAFLSDTGGRARPDGIPDNCETPLADCDMDGQSDGCELGSQTQVDLDFNGVPDDCESVVMGACCVGGGTCSVETPGDCSTMGGAYQGDGSTCSPNPCAEPTGACCTSGTCTEGVTINDCTTGGGVYQGDGVTCDLVTCPPANDNCDSPLPITNGVTPFSTAGASTDGPDEPGVCTKFSDTQVGSDIWYCYTATCNGDLMISTCGDADYDTKLAIYDGCSCPDAGAIACQDDSPGCSGNTTELVVSVIQGNSYLIRVGGYSGASGSGNLTILCDAACAGPVDGDLNEDGSVNGIDIHYLVDGLLNGATPAYICHGDFDSSGDLDMADIPSIVDALLGL